MKEQTTTAAVLLLENIEQKQARREAAARARRPETTLELYARVTKRTKDGKMISYAFQPDFQHISGIQYLLCGDDAARITLKRMSANTGTKLYTDLLNTANLDRQNRNRATIAQEQAEAEAEADRHEAAAQQARKDKKHWKKIMNSITRTDEEIAAAATLYAIALADEDEHTRAAKKARSTAKAKQQALDDAAGSGYFEDLAQEAALAAIINQQAGNDIQTTRTAASRAVTQLSHPDALNTCRTDAQLLTTEEAADLMNRYAVDLNQKPPKHYESRTKGNKNSYFTVEIRTGNAEYKKLVQDAAEGNEAAREKLDSLARATDPDTGKEGIICKVTHRYTTAPYMLIDFWNTAEDDEAIEDTKNNGINAIFKQSDVEAITDLFNRANLTDRQRLITSRAADATASRHAKAARAAQHEEYAAKLEAQRQAIEAAEAATIAARRAYHDNPSDSTAEALRAAEATEKRTKSNAAKHAARDARDAQKAEDKAAAAARWTSAFDRSNIASEKTQANIKSQIKTALFGALNHPEQGPITLEEYQERETRKYTRLMKDSRRGCHHQSESRPDIIRAVQKAAEAMPAADPVISWQPTPTCYTVTAEEIKAAEEATRAARTAELNAHGAEAAAIEYRRIIAAHVDRADWTQTKAEQYSKTHTAAAAALVIFDSWTARERAEAARAYQRARAREEAETRRAAERRPGYREEVYRLAPDWTLWQTFTEDEKSEHNRYFEAIRTR